MSQRFLDTLEIYIMEGVDTIHKTEIKIKTEYTKNIQICFFKQLF